MKKILLFVFISVICVMSVYGAGNALVSAHASSTLAAQGKISYRARNAIDGKTTTAWVEGKKDQGIGQFILLGLGNDVVTIKALQIYPGYGKNEETFKNNSRPKSIHVIFGANEGCGDPAGSRDCPDYAKEQIYPDWEGDFILKDENRWQTISLPNIKAPCLESAPCIPWLKIVITDIYPGAKYSDMAISEIKLDYAP